MVTSTPTREVLLLLFASLLQTPFATDYPYQGLYSGSIEEYEVVTPVKVTEEGESHQLRHKRSAGGLSYRLEMGGRVEELVLMPSVGLVAHGARVRRGSKEVPPINSDCHFRGSVAGQPGSSVALSACHNGLVGLIRNWRGEYWIEPVKRHNWTVGLPHLVYQRPKGAPSQHSKRHRNKKKKKKNINCGTREPRRTDIPSYIRSNYTWMKKNKLYYKPRPKRSISRERHVEALLVADTSMVNFHKDSDLETYLLTIMNIVSSTYQDPSIGNYINIVVVRIILLDDDINDGLNITVNADQALKNFCKWQMQQNPTEDDHPNHHDVAILITRKDICSRRNIPCSTLGVAHVGGMCQPERSCNLNEDNGITLAHTITHELGHNFGMYHDTPQAGCEGREGPTLHVMTPNFEADTTHIAWSGCSRRDITQFLDLGMGYCLEDLPSSEEPYSYPDLPPGALYNADHQCKLQFGSISATVCSPLEEICSRLWCMVDGQCTSMLYPAASGTNCGKHKWCINQKCVTIGEKPDALDGGWGEWGSWSSCSRSCGGGVATRQRHCDNPIPAFGGKFCVGERQKYKVCNTDACPEGMPSFRSEQCSIYNDQQSDGKYYTFKPYFEKGEPCHLYCSESEQSLIEPFGDSVLDGTPCNLGTRDMCIAGICMKVGCDWVVDSDAIEDKCGICRGNGSQCSTISGEFTKTLSSGYVEAVQIPTNSRNIILDEKGNFRNYISISNVKKTTFFLNGKREHTLPGEFDVAGTQGMYERKKEKEKILIPGPIKQEIVVHVVNRGKNNNSALYYEYSVPKGVIQAVKKYEWEFNWSGCTKSCGNGTQARMASCHQVYSHFKAKDEKCGKKPENIVRPCNEMPCPTRWWMGPWQACSSSCGKGSKSRTVMCVSDRNQTMALPDSECQGQTRPPETAPCANMHSCKFYTNAADYYNVSLAANSHTKKSYSVRHTLEDKRKAYPLTFKVFQLKRNPYMSTKSKWLLHPWEPCSATCGPGYQHRVVICSQFAKSCDESTKPIDVKPCLVASCS